MNRYIKTILILLSILPLQGKGPAGIVLYAKKDTDTYFLLADESDKRGWCGFGGGDDEGESILETASREVEEETRRYFKKEWLHEQIKNQKPSISANGFNMFLLEVPFVPAQKIQEHALEDKTNLVTREKVNFAWIPATELTETVKNNLSTSPSLTAHPTSHTKFYWDVWLNGVKPILLKQEAKFISEPIEASTEKPKEVLIK